jgi:hypothetical protein
MNRLIVIGGGAAGFFAAINAKEKNPDLQITILEKGNDVLQKVKISGGGRCNVTHACFDPKELTSYYPRGEKELLGPFHTFMTGDTFEWFEQNGISLKIEADGRVFPESNSSQTIIDCFLRKAEQLDIEILKNQFVTALNKSEKGWMVQTKTNEFQCEAVVYTTGSSKQGWKLLDKLNHTIISPVPSLFTFNIKDERIINLPGVSVPNATVQLKNTSLEASGPLLITHWGLSGPAVLKLSAFGARILHERNYEYRVEVNWISQSNTEVEEQLLLFKKEKSSQKVVGISSFVDIPKRLWDQLALYSGIKTNQNWADLTKTQIENLTQQITRCQFEAKGKSTFKEEFVTAGGVDLKEINFKTFESRLHSNLYLIGEVLNIDAVTGGFNFQNAWTGGWIVSESLSSS